MALFDSLMVICVFILFFFFQAEDGIRDLTVTGVQTCALPILAELAARQASILAAAATLVKPGGRLVYATCSVLADENERIVEGFLAAHPQFVSRSEERRVGKECRLAGWACE